MRLHTIIPLLLAAVLLAGCGAAGTGSTGNTGGMGSGTATEGGAVVTSGALQISDIWARATGDTMTMAPSGDSHGGGMGTMAPSGDTQGGGMDTMAPSGDAHGGAAADMGGVSAAYMTIRNSGSSADQLLKVEGDVANSIELHTMVDDGGVMRMRPVENIEIPAGGEATLKPGGLHVMLIGMKRSLKAGETVSLKLTFAQAGTVDVQAQVRETP